MGKILTDEDIKLNVIINGNVAQKELLDLEKSTRKLTEENKGLLLQKKLLEKQGKKESDDWKALTATIKENSASINQNKIKMNELQKEIGITGLTMKQLTDRARTLKFSLQNAIPEGEAHQKYTAELTQISSRINELSGKAKTAGFSIGSMADGFNRYAALGASVIAMGTGVILSLQKMIDFNSKLADAQSNVQKTTGMTKIEVDELTKSFGLMKTRTARIDLLGIAETGGRLGIAKAEIGDFVKVMDKASVSLGDSFEGGPDVVAEKLGRIKGLYDELKNTGVELAFESVGSALNDLGASGTASEANVAEFVTRVGAMPDAFKPSIATALGLGAAFEESGIKAEVAAGNYSKVISIAANNTKGFAQFMGRSKKSVEDLINTNPNEFFLQFATSLKGLSATDLAKTLDSLKLNDNEVKMVLGAASKNVDLFRDKIDLANNSLNQGTSLTTEYDIKNNNLAATLDKLKKSIVGAFSSESLVNWLASAAEWIAKVIGATNDVDGSGQKWRNTLAFIAKAIAIVTAALLTNVAWIQLSAMWTGRNTQGMLLNNLALRANAIGTGIATIATQAFALVQALLTGNLTKARQALIAMSAAMKTTPWGLILSVISAVAVAYVAFSDNAKKAATAQSMLADNMRDADAIVTKQTASMRTLIAVAQDETASKEARLAAIKKLNEISPEYLGNLTLENIKTMQGKAAIDAYVKSLEKKAMMQVLEKRQAALLEQIEEKKGTPLEDEIKWYDQLIANAKNFGNVSLASVDVVITASQRRQKALEDLQAQLNFTNEQMAAFLKDNPNAIAEIETGAIAPNIPEGKTQKEKKPKKYDDSYLKEEQKFLDDLLALRRKTEEAKLATMQEGFEKEMEAERINHKYKILELKNQLISEKQLNDVDKDIAIAEKAGDHPKVKALENIKKMMLEKNAEINKQIEYEDTMHNLRLRTIGEKAQTDRIKKLQEKYEREKTIRETAYNNEISKVKTVEEAKDLLRDSLTLKELSKIKTLDDAKKALQDKFNKEEIDKEKAHLTNLLKELEKMVSPINFGGIDLNLLTPEQKQVLEKQIEEVRLLISKLNATKSGDDPNAPKKEIDLGLGGQTDILGFTQDQWLNFFKNIEQGTIGIQSMQMAVGAMQNLWSAYNQFVAAGENASLKKFEQAADGKKRKLKQQLDNGFINQVQYRKGIEKIDQDVAKEKAEIEYKQAKREKQMAIVAAIINTAKGVGAALAVGPPMGFVFAGMAAIMGALQIATIAKQPLPAKGYEEGMYSEDVKRQQDGKVFKSRYGGKTKSGLVKRPTHFLTGENGPEMIIDSKAYTRLSPEVRNALVRELRGIKGFENGYYKDDTLYSGPPKTPTTPEDNNPILINILAQNTAVMVETLVVMKDLRDNGVTGKFFRNDLKSMAEIDKGMKDYKQLKSANKS